MCSPDVIIANGPRRTCSTIAGRQITMGQFSSFTIASILYGKTSEKITLPSLLPATIAKFGSHQIPTPMQLNDHLLRSHQKGFVIFKFVLGK